MKTLSLDIVDLSIERYYCDPESVDFELYLKIKLKIKYKLEPELYHDLLKIYVDCYKCENATYHQEIYRKVVSNPSNKPVIKEETISAKFSEVLTVAAYTDKKYHADFSKPGTLAVTLVIYPTYVNVKKKVTISFYWDPKKRKISNIKISGIIPPKPIIDKKSTKLIIGNKKLDVGKYQVVKGSKIGITYKVTNIGGTGNILVKVVDTLNNKTIVSKTHYLHNGESVNETKFWNIHSNQNIKVGTYYLVKNRWIKCDEYGC